MNQNDIIAKVISLPKWAELAGDEQEKRDLLLKELLQLKDYSSEQLRPVIIEIQNRHGDDIAVMSNVFVLNRLLFQVPLSYPRDKFIPYGAWSYPTHVATKESINLLWPVSHDDAGRLVLDGVFDGYYGDKYDAVGEFDFFEANWSRTK